MIFPESGFITVLDSTSFLLPGGKYQLVEWSYRILASIAFELGTSKALQGKCLVTGKKMTRVLELGNLLLLVTARPRKYILGAPGEGHLFVSTKKGLSLPSKEDC
jgi:hypothetical protein